MKITKQRLRQIIKEELSTVRESDRESDWYDDERGYETQSDMEYGTRDDIGLGDLQSDEQFTGGTPEERMNILINARDVLSKMSDEKLEDLSKSLDAAQVAVLRHILANPMYAAADAAWEKEVDPQGDETALEEAALWDKEALKKRYPKVKHALIDKEHAYGTSLGNTELKLNVRSASTQREQGHGGY